MTTLFKASESVDVMIEAYRERPLSCTLASSFESPIGVVGLLENL